MATLLFAPKADESDPRAYKNFKAENMIYRPPKRNNNGGCSVAFGYSKDGNLKKLYVQTPKCRAPFGINTHQSDDGRNKYSLPLAFSDLENDPMMRAFYTFMESFDSCNIATAQERSVAWFGKEFPLSVLKELYRNSAKEPKDAKYDPTFSVKIPQQNDRITTTFYDENKDVIDSDHVTPGCEIVALLECSQIWFMNKQFGATFNLVQARVYNTRQEFSSYAIEDEDAPPVDADAPPAMLD